MFKNIFKKSNYDYLNEVKSLPKVDKVEILVLEKMLPEPTKKELLKRKHIRMNEWAIFWIENSLTFSNDTAQEIARLWRSLPHAQQARCHWPPYALRFFDGDQLILEGTICWTCNNIYTKSFKKEGVYTFDATHETSQQLLNLLKELAPLTPTFDPLLE